ncbi:carbohydrate esterase family 4 protein [Flagelloscypha sp. PMI_526]|nr:carbohydrate esterase family 4 protein [Flagelloscypha sp. PMI_526]
MVYQLTLAATLTFVGYTFAHADPNGHSDITKRFSGSWFHPREHPAYDLFGRADVFPAIGTPEWKAGFPPPLISTLTADQYTPLANLKPAWKAALEAAVKAGKIPNVPQTTNGTYPQGTNANDKSVCSAVNKVCRIDGDIWEGPDGTFASSFDDGPTPATPTLLKFLTDNKVTTTHFLIGTAILNNVEPFKQIVAGSNDLAVHTWTHRAMTSLTNEQVAGELGWTMQLIYNSTSGKLPKYWRPPTGDTDARVSAIAREVFGLKTVIWNQDTEDWQISTKGQTFALALSNLTSFIDTHPKSPNGLIVLEHELDNNTVGVFMQGYPDIAAKGWKFASLATAFGGVYNSDASLFGGTSAASGASSTSGTTSPTKTGSATHAAPISTFTCFSAVLAAMVFLLVT